MKSELCRQVPDVNRHGASTGAPTFPGCGTGRLRLRLRRRGDRLLDVDIVRLEVRLLEGDEVACVHDERLSSGAGSGLHGDTLTVNSGDALDSERTRALRIQLAKHTLSAHDQLSQRKVEQHGRVDLLLLLGSGCGAYAPFNLGYPFTPQQRIISYLGGENIIVGLELRRSGVSRKSRERSRRKTGQLGLTPRNDLKRG